ncbi:MAG: FHA domain-containing protein [Eubacteriales bacterium]|nr:FHA domain-containing protein [Eubacteriales bacterium]
MLFACMCLSALCTTIPVPAEPKILENVMTTEGNIRIYTRGISGDTDLRVLAGTAECPVQEEETGVLRTWILVDNSESIPVTQRESLKSALIRLLDSHGEQEEIRFGTFGENIDTINDFSTDYDAVRTSIQELKFHNRDTFVFRILSDALMELDSMERIHCASRILLITDGGESSGGDYHLEELKDRIRDVGIPIYTLGCGGNSEMLEVLSYLSRKSGGEYRDVEAAKQQELFPEAASDTRAILVEVPDDLKDGGGHQIAIYERNGDRNLLCRKEITFAQVPVIEATNTPIPTSSPTPEPSQVEENEIRPEDPADRNDRNSFLLWILIPAGVLLFGIAGGILLVKKRRAGSFGKTHERNASVENEQDREKAQELFSGEKGVDIQLTDVNNPLRIFRQRVSGSVLFGKGGKDADWVLTGDKSISRRHGRLTVREREVYIEDLHSRNGIWLNKSRLTSPEMLQDGDLLRLGDSEFTVSVLWRM